MKIEMPFGAGRRVGRAGEHEVHDLLAQVVVAEGDEDLLAGDAVGAVGALHGLRGEGADVRAGVRLGEVHGAGPLAADHLRQVLLLLLVVTVVEERLDGALREQRTERERHVRGRHHLLDGEADRAREPAAAELLGQRHRAPASLDVAARTPP